jgi:hypothetical protein
MMIKTFVFQVMHMSQLAIAQPKFLPYMGCQSQFCGFLPASLLRIAAHAAAQRCR